ncbi:cytochrome P450, partial [Neoconidiobolus thromboides FSU 785]
DNIANIDGEEWKRHRRMINPIFKRGWDINVFFNIGINLIQHIQLNQTNKQFDLLSTLKRAALDSLGLSVFDVEFNYIENETNEMARLYVKLINAMDNIWFYVLPVLNYLPISSRLTLKKDAKRFRQLIQLMIDEKRQQLQQVNIDDIQPNLLTTLVQASDNNTNDNGLTDEEIINDMIAFFIAGHDTTAHTISTILYYLSKNQDIQTKLRDEIYQIVGEKIKDSNKLHTITQDEINQMIYLEAVISESMRILPTVNMLPRKCTKDYYFENEIYFKKGQPLMLNFALAMKGNAHFKNPEEFNPNRFLIVNELGNLSINKKLTKELLGFGYGPRMCIGSQFSLLEQKVFLILILSTFNVELPENSPHYDNPTLPALGFISPKDLKLN